MIQKEKGKGRRNEKGGESKERRREKESRKESTRMNLQQWDYAGEQRAEEKALSVARRPDALVLLPRSPAPALAC